MPSKHAGESLGVRAPKEVRADAIAVLAEHGISLQRFVITCLIAVTKNPKDFLKSLKKYRPDPPPRGMKRGADLEATERWE